MKYLFLLMIVTLASCKPSNQYDTDNLYPIPKAPVITQTEIATTDMVQDADIQPFIDEHEDNKTNAGVDGIGKTIYYKKGTLTGNVLGTCYIYNDANLIVVSSTFWATASDWDKRSVILHELGHCDLGRGHRTLYWQGTRVAYDGGVIPNWGNQTKYLSNGTTLNPNYRGEWPLSLMHRSIVREAKFSVESDYYIHELYHQGLYEDPGFGNEEMNCVATWGLDGNIHFEGN